MNEIRLEELILEVEAYQNVIKGFSSLALLAETNLDRVYYEKEMSKFSRFLKQARNNLEEMRLGNGKEC